MVSQTQEAYADTQWGTRAYQHHGAAMRPQGGDRHSNGQVVRRSHATTGTSFKKDLGGRQQEGEYSSDEENRPPPERLQPPPVVVMAREAAAQRRSRSMDDYLHIPHMDESASDGDSVASSPKVGSY